MKRISGLLFYKSYEITHWSPPFFPALRFFKISFSSFADCSKFLMNLARSGILLKSCSCTNLLRIVAKYRICFTMSGVRWFSHEVIFSCNPLPEAPNSVSSRCSSSFDERMHNSKSLLEWENLDSKFPMVLKSVLLYGDDDRMNQPACRIVMLFESVPDSTNTAIGATKYDDVEWVS